MIGCFCGMYNRVGVHAYGCPAGEEVDPRCTCPREPMDHDPYYQCAHCEQRQIDAEEDVTPRNSTELH